MTTSTNPRAIQGVYPAPRFHWVGDGFRVAGYFSSIPEAARRLSPFLMLDYHATHEYPATERRRGVGPHPHRGFETVTLAFQGSVAHHDSAGNGGVIGPGDVQWMTAASGILHQEYHEQGYARRGGPFQMAQLWVNLPRQHKMAAPAYQALTADEMGKVVLPDGAGLVRVIAGEYRGARGPARTFTPVTLLDAHLEEGGRLDLDIPTQHNAALLVMDGEVIINGSTTAQANDFVLFANQGQAITVAAKSSAQLLLMAGQPIDEPIVQYGPFVMNTRQEIEQAISDFSAGKFGELGGD